MKASVYIRCLFNGDLKKQKPVWKASVRIDALIILLVIILRIYQS